MIRALTLSSYITRVFLAAALVVLVALTLLVGLFDFIELLRRAATKPDVSFGLVSTIAALRLPWMSITILPFAVLLGGIGAFWRLTRSSELVVARAAGISAWQFLALPVGAAALLGMLAMTVISPLSSVMLSRAEQLDNIYLRTSGGPMRLAGGQLWLRQSDPGLDPHGVSIIHAMQVAAHKNSLQASSITVFRLDSEDRLVQRIEAATARLVSGQWVLDNARVLRPSHLPDPPHTVEIPTDLTVRRIQESFASPDTLSFWSLPDFIRLLDRSGFSSLRHRLRFQSLLALPLLCATMALVAAGFSMRPSRRGGVAKMIGSGVAAGFCLFVVSKVAEEFGQSGTVPVVLAAWAPSVAGLMLAVALLLHLEDG
ncbi:putative membrane spanning protein [Granulibacter bethesdensis]|uniref:Membrane spanning protein n=1 Tax=Granulibacter bethesdensis TaxID=364410 RepID=A0AAN0VGN9_9PROT|nr:LPS export ABC transporter permease LptG [Granulibacter bethesdensis]AHJ64099.1 putative membrane spanning protein [Granulibacter bethesdensis]